MPNQFVGDVNRWLLLSQSDIDFATLFVRAWIPFNAWYVNNYQKTSDRYCIDKIKTDNNQLRARLVAMLISEDENDEESNTFKFHLFQLQTLLNRYPIPDAVNQISLKKNYFRNNPITVTLPAKVHRRKTFKAEYHTSGAADLIVIKNIDNSTVYSYNHNKYDLDHFVDDLIHSSLTLDQQRVAKECFNEINPRVKENLVVAKSNTSLKIYNLHLVNEPDLVSQAIIELLYSLRNKLFHGELQPSKSNLSIYEPAYHILRSLLKSLA